MYIQTQQQQLCTQTTVVNLPANKPAVKGKILPNPALSSLLNNTSFSNNLSQTRTVNKTKNVVENKADLFLTP